MELKRFIVLNDKDQYSHELKQEVMLINLAHIISLKPIQISTPEGILKGHWIRLTNGKKYRAIEVPEEVLSALGASDLSLLQGEGPDITGPFH
jgi:hypothetical protein